MTDVSHQALLEHPLLTTAPMSSLSIFRDRSVPSEHLLTHHFHHERQFLQNRQPPCPPAYTVPRVQHTASLLGFGSEADCVSEIPEFGKRKQQHQECKASLGYMGNSRLAWVTQDGMARIETTLQLVCSMFESQLGAQLWWEMGLC